MEIDMRTKYDREAILKDYLDNVPRKEIVKKYGISPTLIWHILDKKNLLNKHSRPCYTLTKEFLEEHYVRLKKNASLIAKELGINSHAVGDALRRHGFKTKQNGRTHERNRDYGISNWKGCGEISGTIICELRNRARRKGMEFNLTAKFLWELYQKQNGKCALSGEEITIRQIEISTDRSQTASLDRIDSSKGYIKGNVQWIHKDINKMKLDFEQSVFIYWCQKIGKFQTEENNE